MGHGIEPGAGTAGQNDALALAMKRWKFELTFGLIVPDFRCTVI